MDELVRLSEIPTAGKKYMLAGWQQWADAGSISSGLPQYLIDLTGARKIGEIKPHGFYFFQIPGTHHFMRPEIKLEEGYRQSMTVPKNEFYYAGDDEQGLVIFLGEEPHMNADRYADAFFDAVEQLGVSRVVAVGGVYGALPYDKDRDLSCAYSLVELKSELENYAVRFSSYEGGTTIGSYLLHQAEPRGIEFCVFYAFVPAYEFSQGGEYSQGVRIDNDYKAWYDLMRRVNHMFKLGLDLVDLEQKSEELIASMDSKLDKLARQLPQLKIRDYLRKVAEEFEERTFMPLSDVWEEELGDLFEGLDDDE